MTDRREPEPTQPVELSDATQPVEATDETGLFARSEPPSGPLVSPTAANILLAEALPPPAAPDPTSAIDALFGEDRFRDPDEGRTTSDAATSPPSRSGVTTLEPPHMTRTHRILLGVAGGLVALLALAALFFLGTRLPVSGAPAVTATPSATRTPTPTPVPTVLPAGPVAPGSYRWDRLLGGECLTGFSGPWAERFTVVDCAAPHPAQLVLRGRLADPATPGYPGAAALQTQMPALCSAPGVIDLGAASAYPDAQIEASYPATAAQWDDGDRWYFCFVDRASGQPLTGSVAAARATISPAP